MDVYFLSGLGADKRAFSRITIPPEFKVHHIEWIKPLKEESLKDYAKRLAVVIDDSKPFALVGLSFGGMMAVEIAQFFHPVKTILISSVATSSQLPPYQKLARYFKLYKLLPYQLIKKPSLINYWIFGVKEKQEKEMLAQILNDTDLEFLKWAIGRIVSWKNKVKPENLFHIHGSADKIFPIIFVKPDVIIKNGGHLMIHKKAAEISGILAEQLNKLTGK